MGTTWVNSVEDLLDLISYVILYAPDEFPEEDYLGPEDQMSLSRAFTELEHGLSLAVDAGMAKANEPALREVLTASRQAYERGDDVAGATLLQRFETELFGAGAVG
ncbi:MAG TPA: hypothetical protein VF846_21610 [Thermoanaerobaculia bacterium]|jgi:hypothetical protein